MTPALGMAMALQLGRLAARKLDTGAAVIYGLFFLANSILGGWIAWELYKAQAPLNWPMFQEMEIGVLATAFMFLSPLIFGVLGLLVLLIILLSGGYDD